jgi:AraC-like DNA-binding protein
MTQASWIYDRLYLPYKLAGLVDAAKELGVEPASVLRGTGFAPDDLSSFGMKSSVAQFVKGCENATRLVDDSSLPFRVGQRMHLSAYGVYGYTLLSSPSIRMFLDNAVKYHRLATPVFRVEWGASKERFVWRLLKPTVSIENAHCRNFLLAQQVFQHALHMQDGLGEQYRPLYVLLPEGLRAFESMFGAHLNCPVSFWDGPPEIYHDAEVLDRPTTLANKFSADAMQTQCDRQIAEFVAAAGIAHRVHRIVCECPENIPPISEMAARLRMNERTLRRKLTADATSFGEIVNLVRTEVAQESLRKTDLSVEDIGALVGFNDAANFRKAFRKWTRKTPKEYRTRLALAGGDKLPRVQHLSRFGLLP